jgi:hypothetical protein
MMWIYAYDSSVEHGHYIKINALNLNKFAFIGRVYRTRPSKEWTNTKYLHNLELLSFADANRRILDWNFIVMQTDFVDVLKCKLYLN